MFKIMIFNDVSGDEEVAKCPDLSDAMDTMEELVQADAEDVMRHGIPDLGDAPTYAEALRYVRDFFYITKEDNT